MSILNITPDSFSDGGPFYKDELRLDRVLRHAEGSISAGSSILDGGGEALVPARSDICH